MMKSRLSGSAALVWVVLAGGAATFAMPMAAEAQSQAQEEGVISGRVVDASGRYGFQGARVVVEELGLSATTERDGGFRFGDLAPGTYTLKVEYLGAEPAPSQVEVLPGQTARPELQLGENQVVIVVGQSASAAAALNRERQAVNNIDVLSSDAIGQFPDENVAEALQRVPGLAVIRDQGEGRSVSIRGAASQFNSVTINGLRVPSPGGSRGVNLDVVASELVESAEISKTLTPAMDADGVGGNIEITTLTAFDLGNSLTVSAEGSYNEKLEETSPRGSITATRLFSIAGGEDNFGVTASYNQFDREFAVDNLEAGNSPLLDSPQGGAFRSPESMEQRDYELSRERIGGTLNFDFRPDDNSEYYLRTLFSDFADTELELEHEYLYEDGDVVELDAGGARFTDGAVEKRGKKTTATRDILSIVAGGENRFNDWLIDYQIGYAVSTTDEPFSLGSAFLAEGLDIGYVRDGRRETPLLFSDSPEIDDPEAFEGILIELEEDFVEEIENSYKFNAGRDVDYGNYPGRIQFGVQARLREKEADVNNTNFEDFGQPFTLADVVGPGERDYPLGDFGPYVDAGGALREYFADNRQNFSRNEEDFLIDSQAEDYQLEEDIFAAYVMSEVDINGFELLGGVRVEHTTIDQQGFRAIIDDADPDGLPDIEPFTGSNEYTEWFPSLQGVYRFSERLHVRLGANRTIARPDFEAASPRQIIEIAREGTEVEERVAEVGNPDLDPLYSNNFDAEVTFYPPGDLSAASIGVFYKDIEDFFVTTDVAGQAPFEDFDEVEQTINGDSAEVMGIEFSYVQQLGFLPSPFDGFILTGNYSIIDSEADVPFRDEPIPLPEQADSIANVSIGYEKYGLSARLAANYRGEYFDGVEDAEDPDQDRYVDGELRVDFQAQYAVTERWSLLFNVTNITDEPFYAYLGDPDFNSQYDEFGRTIEFGLKARF